MKRGESYVDGGECRGKDCTHTYVSLPRGKKELPRGFNLSRSRIRGNQFRSVARSRIGTFSLTFIPIIYEAKG